MKTIFKVWIFMVLMMLAGCEVNEQVIRNEGHVARIKIREASLDMLLTEDKFLNAYSKVYASKNRDRTATEDQYNFSIVSNGAKVLEDGARTSYTFKITRGSATPDYFENLVISVDSMGQSNAYIIKYSPDEALRPADHASFHFQGNIDVMTVEESTSEAGRETVCVTANVMMCNQADEGGVGPEHVAGHKCKDSNYMYSVTVITCDSTGGGGSFGAGAGQYTGGNNTGGQTGSGGGGDEGSTDNPPANCPRCPNIITAPVEEMEPGNMEPPVTPCDHLKNLISTQPVRQSFNTLEQRKYQPAEWGFGFQTGSTSSTIMAPSVIESSYSDPNILNMNMAIGGNFIGASHTHPIASSGFYPMFSMDDIDYLFNVSRKHNNNGQPKDYSVYVLTLTVPEGVFAIKIKDPLKFYSNFNLKRESLRLRIENTYQKMQPTSSMDSFKIAFLDIIKDFDLGIGFYEATENITKWGEIQKEGRDTPVINPCE